VSNIAFICQLTLERGTSKSIGQQTRATMTTILVSGSIEHFMKGSCLHYKGSSKQDYVAKDPMITAFASETWLSNVKQYANPLLSFSRPEPGCSVAYYEEVPSCLALFEKY